MLPDLEEQLMSDLQGSNPTPTPQQQLWTMLLVSSFSVCKMMPAAPASWVVVIINKMVHVELLTSVTSCAKT